MSSNQEEALEEMRQELDTISKRNRAAFEGAHADALHNLLGLSDEELDEILPTPEDRAVYAELIDVVKDASARNSSAADLKRRIQQLGTTAIAVAKKAGLLAGAF